MTNTWSRNPLGLRDKWHDLFERAIALQGVSEVNLPTSQSEIGVTAIAVEAGLGRGNLFHGNDRHHSIAEK